MLFCVDEGFKSQLLGWDLYVVLSEEETEEEEAKKVNKKQKTQWSEE